ARPPGCDVASRSRYLPIAQRAGRPGHASLRGLFSHRVGRGQPALFIRRARTRRKPKGASMIIDLDVTNLCNRAYKLAEDVRNESSPDNVSRLDWFALRGAAADLLYEVEQKLAASKETRDGIQ